MSLRRARTGLRVTARSSFGVELTLRYPLPRFENAATRPDEQVADNVGQHALNSGSSVVDEKWMGTEEEERDCFVSELCYIHSKLMIVDDRRAICGSSSTSRYAHLLFRLPKFK